MILWNEREQTQRQEANLGWKTQTAALGRLLAVQELRKLCLPLKVAKGAVNWLDEEVLRG